MASRKQLEDALISAHESGDTEAAQLFADEIKSMGSTRDNLMKSNPAEYDSASPEFQAKYGATSGMSGMQKVMAGAGKSVMDTGRGLKQLGMEAYDLVRPKQAKDLIVGTPAEQYRQQMSQVQQQDANLMSTGAGVAGNIAGTLATTLIPAGAVSQVGKASAIGNIARGFINPQSIRAAAAGGAALGAIQPVGTEGSRVANMGIGALTGGAGQAVLKGVGKIAQPIKNALSPVDARAVATLKSAGIPLDAAQASGSQRATQIKRFLSDNPLTSAGQQRQYEKTAAGFTRAALKSIGEAADVADDEVLGRASTRIGKVFDDISKRNAIKIGDDVLDDLVAISQQANATLEQPQARLIQNQIDEVISKAAETGELIGPAYQNIKSNLDLLTNSNQPGVKHWAATLRGKLDDALQNSVSAADYDALKNARKEYGALSRIVESVNPDGNISASKLYNATNVKAFGQKKAMATGIRQTQLQKLAKAGKRIIPDHFPNSGTPARAALQLLLPGAIGAGYGAAQGGDLGDIAKYGAGGIAAPFLLQKAMNNPSAVQYLTRGLQGPARNALLASSKTPASMIFRAAPTAGLLGLQASRQ